MSVKEFKGGIESASSPLEKKECRKHRQLRARISLQLFSALSLFFSSVFLSSLGRTRKRAIENRGERQRKADRILFAARNRRDEKLTSIPPSDNIPRAMRSVVIGLTFYRCEADRAQGTDEET